LASETGEMVDKVISRRYYDLTLNQESEYKRLWEEYQKAQEEEKQEETEQYRQLVEGMLIRQYLAKEMTEHTIKLTDELLEDGEKVVIMTNFQEEMEILANYYGKRCVTYNGKMSTKQKDKAQDEFLNNKKVQVFIGQIVASGVGLSLPVSRKLIFNSFSWSAADNKQAEDRVYRLTQTEDVEIIYQLFNNTWAQQMFDKVLYKDYLSNQIIKSEINK
jgi:SNF2 family DNA or RNA helicase